MLSGCGAEDENITYSLYDTSANYGIISTASADDISFFADDLCVADTSDIGTDQVDSAVAYAAGVFNLATKNAAYAQSIHERMYPASTTKIMTALVAIKYGNLDQTVTVSELACNQASDSSVCNLKPGDQLTVRQLLYGMMLRSGNDAAIAVAEAVGGSVEGFVDMMNAEARALGATNTHFVNPNGLHDDEHYTTVYDLYLIMNEAIKYNDFTDVIHTASYEVIYTSADGSAKTVEWANTNQYLSGKSAPPEGYTVVGGKTGTTAAAKNCLVLYSMNPKNEPVISIVLGADARSNLYMLMNEVLAGFGGI